LTTSKKLSPKLTRAQQRHFREIVAIATELGLDYPNVFMYSDERRLNFLGHIRSVMVRGFIVEQYTLADEFLSSAIAAYFFRGRNFIRMWKRERFANFNYFVLEKLSVRDKLALVKEIGAIPKGVASAIEDIIQVRNVVAHVFFPENVRAVRRKSIARRATPPISYPYKGADIFSSKGLTHFKQDSARVGAFLAARWAKRP